MEHIESLKLKSESESIQLISQNNKGDLVINETALDMIKNINGNLAVFVIVGPYRQGKSYILNRLMDSKCCFKLGHTDNSCTKGVWMSKPILKHSNTNGSFNVIYLDTEV